MRKPVAVATQNTTCQIKMIGGVIFTPRAQMAFLVDVLLGFLYTIY